MSAPSPSPLSTSLRTSRLEALSDGVFAIAMTLLTLTVQVPHIETSGEDVDVTRLLVASWPRLMSYVVSFVVLGVYWVGQHSQFHFIRRADQVLIWLTLFFLMLVAAIPWSATLVGRYGAQRSIIVLYGAHLIAIGAAHFFTWHYAVRAGLVDSTEDRIGIRTEYRLAIAAPATYLVAIAVAFASPLLSLILYATVPLVYVARGLSSGAPADDSPESSSAGADRSGSSRQG